MKTLRFRMPVLDTSETDDLLDLVTDVEGVVAALVNEKQARLDVIVSSRACGLLVEGEVRDALLLAAATAVAA